MEIKFEFDSSYKGTLTVNGQPCEVKCTPSGCEIVDDSSGINPGSFNDLIADKLYASLAGIMQAWCEVDDIDAGFNARLRSDQQEVVQEQIDKYS